ncbi:MAG: hypothetical protein NXI10_16730 [bacterium]|nr:hypothetical protein [bacterium]
MKKTLFIVFILLSANTFGQRSLGFLGKRHLLEVTASPYSPLIYNFTRWQSHVRIKNINDTLRTVPSRWLNSSVNIGYAYTLSKTRLLGVELGYQRIQFRGFVSSHDPINYTTSSEYYRHESLQLQQFVFMPKIEFMNVGSESPLGLSHVLGLGFTSTKIVNRDYKIDIIYGNNPTTTYSTPLPESANIDTWDFIDPTTVHRTLRLFYALRYRTAISRNLFFHFGTRYMVDIPLQSVDFGAPAHTSFIQEDIRRFTLRNIVALDLGVSVPL